MGKDDMASRTKLSSVITAALGLSLAACNQSPEGAAGDLAEQKVLSQEDVLQEEADIAGAVGNEVREESLDDRADAMGDAAEDSKEAAEEMVAPSAN